MNNRRSSIWWANRKMMSNAKLNKNDKRAIIQFDDWKGKNQRKFQKMNKM
jgi:hypothetical protein